MVVNFNGGYKFEDTPGGKRGFMLLGCLSIMSKSYAWSTNQVLWRAGLDQDRGIGKGERTVL